MHACVRACIQDDNSAFCRPTFDDIQPQLQALSAANPMTKQHVRWGMLPQCSALRPHAWRQGDRGHARCVNEDLKPREEGCRATTQGLGGFAALDAAEPWTRPRRHRSGSGRAWDKAGVAALQRRWLTRCCESQSTSGWKSSARQRTSSRS